MKRYVWATIEAYMVLFAIGFNQPFFRALFHRRCQSTTRTTRLGLRRSASRFEGSANEAVLYSTNALVS